ncbi:MAG: sigma-54 dependent transcriptional regulator [Planctomycetota bacterium]
MNPAWQPRILVADDEDVQRNILGEILRSSGFAVATAGSLEDALATFDEGQTNGEPYHLVITDLKMPGGQEGLDLLDGVKRRAPETAVILMTAFSTVASAVRAMKLGALDYLPKPFEKEQLLHAVDQARTKLALERDNRRLTETVRRGEGVRRMVGESPSMERLFKMISRVSRASTNALIRGESGTGKELVARALHFEGPRASKPFLAINCAAIPETLIESELFGHERGAFTGANAAKTGRFEEVGEGTLFLDEIGSMKIDLQAKLLRVIQEREFSRVGSSKLHKFHGRIVAATAQDLEEAVRNGEFREDLYFRLNVVTLDIPPLRARIEDIPPLAEHFLARSADRLGLPPAILTERVLEALAAYQWPGNVRELENCIERMMVLADGEQLDLDLLPPSVTGGRSPFERVGGAEPSGAGLASASGNGSHRSSESSSSGETWNDPADPNRFQLPKDGVVLEEMEAELIRQALERVNGRLEPAAQLLGITYKTLQYRVKKYDLKGNKGKGEL